MLSEYLVTISKTSPSGFEHTEFGIVEARNVYHARALAYHCAQAFRGCVIRVEPIEPHVAKEGRV